MRVKNNKRDIQMVESRFWVFQQARLLIIIATVFITSLSACKKFIEVDAPVTSVTTDIVYGSDSKAIAAMTGIYAQMSSNSFYTNGALSLSLSPELSGDNLGLFAISNPTILPYYKNSLNSQYNGNLTNLWSKLYSIIYDANAVLEGVNKSNQLSSSVKNQLLGETYFIRAFCHFYLTNLYGDVPIAITTDYATNAVLSRSLQKNVYEQIKSDLINSKKYINDNYLDPKLISSTVERVRPNKAAVAALLARVYLFTGDYSNAELQSTEVINNTANYELPSLDQVFLKSSREIIWSIQPITIGENTKEALFYYLPATGPSASRPAFLSPMF